MRADRAGTTWMVFTIGVAAMALAGCGSDDQSNDSARERVDGIQISNAWARASAAGQTTGAVYVELTSGGDTLVAVSVPAAVAAEAQIHEVVPAGSADMSAGTTAAVSGSMSDGMDGMDAAMTMRELEDGLALPAGETVALEPGGNHIMLVDLARPLEAGDEIEVTLEFERAGSVTISVPVSERAP